MAVSNKLASIMNMIGKNIIWVFMLFSSSLYGQIENDLVGTYVLKEEKGIHVVPGQSAGDMHFTSYISFVDTTITHTLILDSLRNVTFIPDTSYHFTLTANFLTDPLVKMYGKWTTEDDTLFITYISLDSIYNFNLNALMSIDTLTGSTNVDEKTLPYKDRISIQLDSPISRAFSIKKYGDEIYGILPYDEKREWIIYKKQ